MTDNKIFESLFLPGIVSAELCPLGSPFLKSGSSPGGIVGCLPYLRGVYYRDVGYAVKLTCVRVPIAHNSTSGVFHTYRHFHIIRSVARILCGDSWTWRCSLYYLQLLALHADALQAGANFPDAFYSNICYRGTPYTAHVQEQIDTHRERGREYNYVSGYVIYTCELHLTIDSTLFQHWGQSRNQKCISVWECFLPSLTYYFPPPFLPFYTLSFPHLEVAP